MTVKKRKQTPQSSTLLDFFGKGTTAGRDTKKPRVMKASFSSTPKHPFTEEIIVIDSSDEDDVVEVPSARPNPRPVQARSSPAECIHHPEARSANPVVNNLSAPASGTALQVEGPNVKSEPDLSRLQCRAPLDLEVVDPATRASNDYKNRQPSPFGLPDILGGQEPPPSGDCSHDGVVNGASGSPLRDDVSQMEEPLIVDDWNMGDDELEFVDGEVKAEQSGSVDIDLTIEEEDQPAIGEQPNERCPVCERLFSGMSNLDIHNHVDECLNIPPDTDTKHSISSLSSNFKTLRRSFNLRSPQLSAPAGPSKAVNQEGSDVNVFSTLMSSYKENEAWKEASTVEDTNFRPTKTNGGRRKAPFYKVMQGMPIAVDAFRYGAIPKVSAYFLTHAHSDHYTNLSAKWDSGPIYCSQGTANLIIHMLRVDKKWVHPLPMDVATTIPNTGGVQVTLIEANHCPGSCLFLFEGKQTVDAGDSAYTSQFVGSSKVFRYLHCGDFRACPQHVLHPAIKGKRIDHVYLDTTYLDPKYCFPPQPLVISACAELAQRLVQGKSLEDASNIKPRTMTGWFTRKDKGDKGKEKGVASPDKVLIVVGTYSIGKERIVKAIANALGTKVYCDSRKAAILRCESDHELDALLTTDPLSAGVHLVPLAVIASDRLKTYVERWKGHFSKAIGFRPTGWTYTSPSGTDTLPSISTVISRSQSRTFTHANLQPMRNSTSTLQVYGVPYSEHSSFFELTCFALSLDWGRMIATVNVGSEASRGKMAKWVERWELERKKRGKVDVVSHRAPDYW